MPLKYHKKWATAAALMMRGKITPDQADQMLRKKRMPKPLVTAETETTKNPSLKSNVSRYNLLRAKKSISKRKPRETVEEPEDQ
jgi:hypothetical protein